MRLAVIGRTQVLYEAARRLRDAGHQICAVVTAPAAPEYTRTQDDFAALAAEAGAAFFVARSLDDPSLTRACAGLDLGVSVNWVSVVRDEHLGLFRLGILNAHLGDLPRYRGNACPNWAIIRGEEQITLSVHLMEGGALDCGRVVAQERLGLGPDTPIRRVYEWFEATAPELLLESVRLLESDASHLVKYADVRADEAFRCYPRLPEDGFIDWSRPAREVHNLVRASGPPFAGAYTYQRLGERVAKLIVLESRVVSDTTADLAEHGHVLMNDAETGESWVRCGDGVLALCLGLYEGEGEPFRPGRRWRSIRARLGVRVEDWLWSIQRGGGGTTGGSGR